MASSEGFDLPHSKVKQWGPSNPRPAASRESSDTPMVGHSGKHIIWHVAIRVWRWFFPPIGRASNSRLVFVLRVLLVALYLIIFAVAVTIINELYIRQAERHMIAWAVAGIFVGIALPLPLNDILMHGLHYVRPAMQRYYIRILWLVPIYSIQSWLALRFYPEAVYFATARELYEAFVLWSFYRMLLEFFPSRDALIVVGGRRCSWAYWLGCLSRMTPLGLLHCRLS
jgi:hypothetical protein